jgi:S-formylglutathione hydrolase
MNGAWASVKIGGKAADVYDPAGNGRPRFGLIYLHGASLETLTGNPVAARLFDELHLACVCPHGDYSWWSDRIWSRFDPHVSAEKHILQAIVPYFRERWQIKPPALGLFGFSMGGQGALRLAFKYAELFPAVAAVSSAIEYYELYGRNASYGAGRGSPNSGALPELAVDAMYDSKEQCRQDSVPMHVHPSRYPPHIYFCIDPDDRDWLRGNDRLHEKLTALGIAHETDFETRKGGHTRAYLDHMADRAIRFLASALDQESKRLL